MEYFDPRHCYVGRSMDSLQTNGLALQAHNSLLYPMASQHPQLKRYTLIRLSLLTLALTFSFAACGEDEDPPATGLNCDTSPLTYDNFGKQFFDICLECHITTNSGADRKGAPSTINFDTFELVKMNISDAKRRAGSASTMPPSSATTTPSTQERADLVEWADCGTKN